MVYEIDYAGGERVGCSSKIVVADRIFYVKLFSSEGYGSARLIQPGMNHNMNQESPELLILMGLQMMHPITYQNVILLCKKMDQ